LLDNYFKEVEMGGEGPKIDWENVLRGGVTALAPGASAALYGYEAAQDVAEGLTPEVPEMKTQINIPRFKGEESLRRRPRKTDILGVTSGFGGTIQGGRQGGDLEALMNMLLSGTLKG
jgi:hypothetical protein